MILREKHPFDLDTIAYPLDVRHINLLAATSDRRTWWVCAGANNGARVLAHYPEEGPMLGCFTARSLHAKCLVREASGGPSELLRRAADRLGIVDIVTPHAAYFPPMPPRPALRAYGIDLPGFIPAETPQEYKLPESIRHRDGWYTLTERALALAAPGWAPGSSAWDIREGIYIAFEGGEYRLVPRKEYYDFPATRYSTAPIARQGDLLVFAEQWGAEAPGGYAIRRNSPEYEQSLGDTQGIQIDRHHIDLKSGTVTHPEHGDLVLPADWGSIMLAPGTSRPFADTGGRD